MNLRTTVTAFELAVVISGFLLADSPSGKIVSVDSTHIKLNSSAGKETSYSLDEKVKVMLDNKSSSIDKLTAGDTATLTMEKRSSGGEVVTLIDAKSAEKKKDDKKSGANRIQTRGVR
jgi:hypothetical protein